jgi:hypothetical protein
VLLALQERDPERVGGELIAIGVDEVQIVADRDRNGIHGESRSGQGPSISASNTLHRIEGAFLRSEVEAAGFKLMDSGSFLRNPADPRDKETPEPAMPKDGFILKFVKPGAMVS